MKFETKIVPLTDQIACIDSVIGDYKVWLELFDGADDALERADVNTVLVRLEAAKYTLQRSLAAGETVSSVAVPVIEPMPRASRARTMNEAWETGLVTPGILRRLEAERTYVQSI